MVPSGSNANAVTNEVGPPASSRSNGSLSAAAGACAQTLDAPNRKTTAKAPDRTEPGVLINIGIWSIQKDMTTSPRTLHVKIYAVNGRSFHGSLENRTFARARARFVGHRSVRYS